MQQCGELYEQESWQQQPQLVGDLNGTTQHGCCFAACPRHMSSPELGASTQPQQQRVTRRTTGTKQPAKAAAGRGGSGAPSLARSSRAKGSSGSSTRQVSSQQAGAAGPQQGAKPHTQPQQQRRTSSASSSAGRGVPGPSRAPVSPNTWASEQTKQLDELWQHWQTQQAKAQAAAGGGAAAAQEDSKQQEQLLDKEQRQELEAAYARASAARSSAKAAAQHAAASRSQRLRAELADLGRMLAEVDTLAAQMEVESGQAAAAVQQFEAELGVTRGVVC